MHIYSGSTTGGPHTQARRRPNRGVRFSVEADPANVTPAARAVRGLAAVFGFDEDRLGQIEQSLAEAVESAVMCGLRGGVDLRIEVGVALDLGMLLVRVTDHGTPLPDGTLQPGWAPSFDSEDAELLPKGGFGLAILLVLTDFLDYHTEPGQNRLTLGYRLPEADRPVRRRSRKVRAEDQTF